MSVRIGLGIAGFPFSSAQAFLKWVDVCEAMGVDSLWLSERLVSKQLQLEPLTAFGVVAGRTERMKFGMNVTVLPFRDPLILAKQCATLDFLSGGRLLPAFGVGSDTTPEFAATGLDPATRGRRSDEVLQIIARLWREDDLDFDGRFFQYRGVSVNPKPTQAELPMWIGGASPAAVRRTARLGTGWLGGVQTPEQVGPVIAAIKAEAAKAGRTIDDDHYGGGFAFRFGSWDDPEVQRSAEAYQRTRNIDPRRVIAVGETEIVARAREFVAAGVSKFVLRPIGRDDDDMESQVRQLCETAMPRVHALETAPA